MISNSQGRKLLAMGFLLAVAFLCLGYRLIDLQYWQHEKLRDVSEDVTRRMFLSAPKRGDIRDIRGNLLAGSVFVKTVCAAPMLISDHREEVARVVAPLLGMSESEFIGRLLPQVRTNEVGQLVTNRLRQVVLRRKVPAERWEQIRAEMKRFPPGVDIKSLSRREQDEYGALRTSAIVTEPIDDQIRVYPNQSLAAHVLGFVGMGDGSSPKGKVDALEGKDGIERTLNSALQGVVGWRTTEMAFQRELVAFRDQDVQAHPGHDVVLTLDSGVQHILELELADVMVKHTPISASGVVVRPATGEILAMAVLPSFNPNNLEGTRPDARRNRIISDIAEPGSTFKTVVVAGALNDGLVSLEDQFDCENGAFWFGGRWLHDHEGYGTLSVQEIIMHSSNIGAAKIGIRMGQPRLYQYMRNFGFGSRTGIPLIGEVPGMVNPLSRWTKLSISRIPMGHEVAVTQLQMVMAIAAVANGGRLMRPILVDRIEDEQGRPVFKSYPQQVRQAVSEHAARLTVNALKTVMSTNGTGRKAILSHYTAAGKTGTAQKLVNGGYRRDKHFSSFIGFFPAETPEVCIGIFLDEPKNGYYGGEAAGPVFRNVAERIGQYLAIPSDIPPPLTDSVLEARGSAVVLNRHE